MRGNILGKCISLTNNTSLTFFKKASSWPFQERPCFFPFFISETFCLHSRYLHSVKKNMDFSHLPATPEGGGKKRLSVERIYQKKTQLEHILLRPDTYIGSVEPVTQAMWVWDEGVGMTNREITFVPGLYKIFDEILVNAADNKQRDAKMSTIKIDIEPENNKISVWNDGKGIPIVEHKVEKMFVPEMIFGHLLTSSNYNDEDKKVTGGRNGYGAKLCNIFSTKFSVETASKEYKKKFKQTWSKNMSKTGERKLVSYDKPDFTCVTFYPDLEKFHMSTLDKDTVALLSRRAYDLTGSTPGIKVYLNGSKLPVNSFRQYVELYTKQVVDEQGEPLKIIHEKVSPRWEICLTQSDKGFQQLSFVNSIATTKGGRHVDHVLDQVTKKLTEVVKKKNKGGVDVKPYQIKNHCWLFVNCLIENPTFDSQTKENMTLQAKKFGSSCSLTDKFLKMASSSGIVDNIMNWVKFKAQSQLQKKSATKSNKLKGVPKLDDANDAGTKHSLGCTLILTEGDSAKTLAVSGLSIVGRDKYGVFPLRGKLLNVRDASHSQIMGNAEINNIIKIMGLKYGKKYESDEELKTLRYGKLMIMTDQDHDGSHIKGLLINFIHSNWPNMLQRRVLEEFITPIVKVTKGQQVLSFYTVPEFEDWKNSTENAKSWKTKYYKGLGTSTSKEAKAYFADMNRHRVRFKYSGPEDDHTIDMAFNKKRADDRKEWLTNYMEERRRCRIDERPEPGADLYSADTRHLTFKDFVNKELVMFSCTDLERSVPSLVDGLKPGQRKVLYTCLRRNDKREVRVAQLAGSVAELSAYHHGETSLMTTIINMAQNFVGSNNLNLLQPIGQFGTRLHGGKDAASPRYIFTMLSPLARHLFNTLDDNLLNWLYDDNQKVEPSWYCPIIPTVLVNGTEGIGTGWSTRVPNHDIREVVENCRRMMRGEDPLPMLPSYKNFKGTIEELEPNKFVVNGEASILDDNTVEISELPIKTWTQPYKENVLEPLVVGTDKVTPQLSEYKEYNTDVSVRFIVKMSEQKLRDIERKGLHKFLNLQTTITCQNTMVMFDEFGCLRKFNSTTEIFKQFYNLRVQLYTKRKDFLLGLLTAESKKLSNQARFILEKIEGKITIFNKAKKILIKMLLDNKYDSDPVKVWKETLQKASEQQDTEADETDTEEDLKGPDFNYILNMPLWSLSKERKDDLLKQRDAKMQELENLRLKTPINLWEDDLNKFMDELEKVEQKEREDMMMAIKQADKKPVLGKGRGQKAKLVERMETKPSPHGIRVVPVIDPSLKPKSGKARVKKEAKPDPTVKKLDEYFKNADEEEKEITPEDEMDMDQPPSLMSRIQKSAEKEKKKATKQSKLTFKPKSQQKVTKILMDSDSESSGMDFKPNLKKKHTTLISDDEDSNARNDDIFAAKNQMSTGTESEEAEVESAEDKADWDTIMGIKKPEKKTQVKGPTKRRKLQSNKTSDSDAASRPKKVAKVAASKKKTTKTAEPKPASKPRGKKTQKKKNAWSDDDEDVIDEESEASGASSFEGGDSGSDVIDVKPRVVSARQRKQAKYTFSDSEADSDF
uniref:DNA topoisomerase 2 n=1 Tax=Phallusia mammillata TaxID=59560 RepID=A0A6F9DVL0_9ASCI|nr:DNA topoisomerase 2-alpha [Phallusia mammillata]